MTAHLFKYECITNLHVGSGEVNYNVIDNEVEKDPANGFPMIHSSGVKGAMREHFADKMSKADINRIFGTPPEQKKDVTSGSYNFLDAGFLARPMRVKGNTMASIPVISAESVRSFLRLTGAFGMQFGSLTDFIMDDNAFGQYEFLTNAPGDIRVEGEKTEKLPEEITAQLKALEPIIGSTYAIARNLTEYDLPVVARNRLENGESKQLWYEEIVPTAAYSTKSF